MSEQVKKSVTGKVCKIIFHDKNTGRSILSLKNDEGKPCRLVGNVKDVEEGMELTATGVWRKDEKYGWQFVAESIEKASQSEEEAYGPVEDGLMHAYDFSNVMSKSLKSFRDIELVYDEEYEYEEFEYIDEVESPNSFGSVINDGMEYSKDKKTLFKCPAYRSEVVIPDSVTSIGDSAFKYCSALESVVIPDSVTSIGDEAFRCCSSLKSVVIPKAVTSIGDRAFSFCSALKSIVIPDSVTSIGDWAFYDCSSLKSVVIPKAVTSIGSCAFHNCSALESVVIPDSVTSIGSYAFSGCSASKSIVIPDSVTSIGDSAFYNCSALESVVIPDSVTSIGSYAFSGCSALKSIVIPDSETSIGDRAFHACSSLKSVVIPDSVTSIGSYAFSGCSALKSIVIPDSVTGIGTSAFKGCSSLESVVIPNSVTSIDRAFAGCSSLESVVIPKSVKSIGDSAFKGCTALKSIEIPNSVTSIGEEAFYGCSALESIVIPNSVASIGGEAFKGCSNLIVKVSYIIDEVGEDAFMDCKQVLMDSYVSFDWTKLFLLNGRIIFPSQLGGGISIDSPELNNLVSKFTKGQEYEKNCYMESNLGRYLSERKQFLTVHFCDDGKYEIMNEQEIRSAILSYRIKYDFLRIAQGLGPKEILKYIDSHPQEDILEFLSNVESPYVKFLVEKHISDKYPIIPVEEYSNAALEKGALYTLMINGAVHIVWENNNDSRATYVFRCTEETYAETREIVFDYVMSDVDNKRQYLRTKKCEEIFKEKPRMVVHTDFDSWAKHLMQV